MRASLKQYRQSPRKVRLVADLMRGKSAPRALTELRFTTKRAAETLEKLLRSALTNAKEKGVKEDNLYISHIAVDEGPTMRRFRPVSRGRGHRIRKRTSHVTLELAEREDAKPAKPKKKAIAKK